MLHRVLFTIGCAACLPSTFQKNNLQHLDATEICPTSALEGTKGKKQAGLVFSRLSSGEIYFAVSYLRRWAAAAVDDLVVLDVKTCLSHARRLRFDEI